MTNGITNGVQKTAILLSLISLETHRVLFSLCVPSKPDNVEYDTLTTVTYQNYRERIPKDHPVTETEENRRQKNFSIHCFYYI